MNDTFHKNQEEDKETSKEKILAKLRDITAKSGKTYKEKINHSSKKHKILIYISAILVFILIVFFIQRARQTYTQNPYSETVSLEKIPFEREDLDRALRYQILNRENKQLQDLKREVDLLRSSLSEKNRFEAYKTQEENMIPIPTAPKKEPEPEVQNTHVPNFINTPRPTTRDLLYGEFKNTPPPPEVEVFSVVGSIKSEPIEIPIEKTKEDAQKKTIFLPPSFVKADLLTGVTAKTTGTSSRDTTPLMLRIRDLAILPNAVKADLKGCFVIAEGYGDLASERIITRLVTLSCVDKKGGAVIDESVDGFIVDEDGGIGLAANVTAKMGTHIARSMWAGFVGGFGKGLSDSQKSFSFSDSGNVNSLIESQDLTKSLKSGLGEGISDGTKDLRSFYLKLAEQTMPVLQSGSSKEVTIVFSKGRDLSIMLKDLY
ncbi:MAG: TraB/VirB10 family protein [Desulforegulaceae bacterium]|nr:TraB/VirB10 family protein [Desulforegulaceae bacterium]